MEILELKSLLSENENFLHEPNGRTEMRDENQ